MKTVAIAGAGLSGLLTAALLAKRGCKVKVFEKSSIIGGRSHILKKDGFTVHYSAHALIAPKAEPVKSILKELELNLKTTKPSLSKFKLYVGGRVVSNPLGSGAFTSPVINTFSNRIQFFKDFLKMTRACPAENQNLSVQEWIDQNVKHPQIKKLIEAYASLSYMMERENYIL